MRAFWSTTNCFCNGLARRILTEGETHRITITLTPNPLTPTITLAHSHPNPQLHSGGFPDNVVSLLLDMYSNFKAKVYPIHFAIASGETITFLPGHR